MGPVGRRSASAGACGAERGRLCGKVARRPNASEALAAGVGGSGRAGDGKGCSDHACGRRTLKDAGHLCSLGCLTYCARPGRVSLRIGRRDGQQWGRGGGGVEQGMERMQRVPPAEMLRRL